MPRAQPLTLEALEKRIRALEAGSEAGQPSYLQVSPSGLVVAEFSGALIASGGVLLKPGNTFPPTSPPHPGQIIGWGNTFASVVAWITAAFSAGAQLHFLISTEAGNGIGILDPTVIAGGVFAFTSAGQQATILDTKGDSDFIQLPGLPGNKIQALAGGSSSATWTASADSAIVTVAHGLTRTPSAVVCNTATFTGAGTVNWQVTGVNSTNFTVVGVLPAANTVTIPFYWMALG